MKKDVRYWCHGAVIGAVYALLTIVTWSFSSMQIQVRVAEALCVLPAFTPAAIPGLFFGCFLAGMLGGNIIDALFGSLATLLAALLTRLISKKTSGIAQCLLLPLPAVLINAVAVPLILYYGYGLTSFGNAETLLPVLLLEGVSVLLGQTVACYGIGLPLFFALRRLNEKTHLF